MKETGKALKLVLTTNTGTLVNTAGMTDTVCDPVKAFSRAVLAQAATRKQALIDFGTNWNDAREYIEQMNAEVAKANLSATDRKAERKRVARNVLSIDPLSELAKLGKTRSLRLMTEIVNILQTKTLAVLDKRFRASST